MTAMQIFGQNVAAPLATNEFTNVVLPGGRYSFMIVDTKVDANMAWASVKLQVLEGDMAGKKISHFFSIGGTKTQQQIDKSMAEMSSLCSVLGIKGTITSMDPFINKCFTTDVTYQKESAANGKTYPHRNWISFALDTMEAYTPTQAPVASLAPTTAPVAQQMFTPEEAAAMAPPPAVNVQQPIPGAPPVAQPAAPQQPHW